MDRDLPAIRVGRDYLKFRGQRSGRLVALELSAPSELDPSFVEYETAWEGGSGEEFRSVKLLVLFFVGERRIPFTQVIDFTPERYQYYRGGLGKSFRIQVPGEGGTDG